MERDPRPPKRPYEPPSIESEEIFETTALACGKLTGQGKMCAGGGAKRS
jgi:hypothetical protein